MLSDRSDVIVMADEAHRSQYDILAQNEMAERIIASPVPVNGRLLIRGEKHLFYIGEK